MNSDLKKIILLIILVLGGGYFYRQNPNWQILRPVLAATQLDIVINEVAWMGTDSSSNNEWIELYNNTDGLIDLTGWTLGAEDGAPNINLQGQISARGYFLLERTGDDSVPNISADQIYTGALSNGGEYLKLFDQNSNLIDAINCNGAWFAGDNIAKKTMERINPALEANAGNFGASENALGTPRAQNSKYNAPPAETPPPKEPPPLLSGAPPPPIKNYSNKIIINELLINPEDSDVDYEFIELYNKSDQEADISGWILEDTQGKIRQYTLPEETKITGWGYLVFYSSDTRLVLNNSGDGVKLLWPNKETADLTPETSGPAKEEESYSWDGANWVWTKTPTAGEKNEISFEEAFLVVEVLDGDTIKLSDGRKVRYIGIDTPELTHPSAPVQCFAEEAKEKNKELVLYQEVRLEKDISDTDNYGRLLRYIYVNDLFVNEYLVKNGYAYSNPYPPDTKYQSQFDKAEAEAKENELGLWQKCYGSQRPEPWPTSKTYSDKIIINEFLPNPKGPDPENEWIELKNTGESNADLKGWKLSDAANRVYVIKVDDFSTTIIPAQGYFLVKRKTSGVALNNTGGDEVQLYWPNDELMDEARYDEKAEEENSYARDEETSEWQWTTTPTPDSANVITRENKPPIALIDCPDRGLAGEAILCDGSDSYDPEGGEIIFLWTFENVSTSSDISPSYAYNKAGAYKINLTIIDSKNLKSTATHVITISPAPNGSAEAAEETLEPHNICITEILPNPEGADIEAEFIELFNAGTSSVDLSGWQLDDMEAGGSQPYTLPKNTLIRPKEYLAFKRSETKIALNNDYDSARLIDPRGEIISEISYDDAIANSSYALADNVWQWSSSPTPKQENKIISAEVSKIKTAAKKTEAIIPTTLEEIRNYENNTRVSVQGVVTVEPGILGANIFYIQGSPGIQIYSYKKDFPELANGDIVTITGILSESGGEKRLKINAKSDIRITGREDPPEPQYFKNSEINEEREGQLVIIEGVLIEINGSNYYLDDGNDEVRVYIKTSTRIKKPQVKEGATMIVSGIVSQTDKGYVILPRYQADIRVGQVTSTSSEAGVIEIPQGDANSGWEKYVWVLNGGLMVIVAGMWRRRKSL